MERTNSLANRECGRMGGLTERPYEDRANLVSGTIERIKRASCEETPGWHEGCSGGSADTFEAGGEDISIQPRTVCIHGRRSGAKPRALHS